MRRLPALLAAALLAALLALPALAGGATAPRESTQRAIPVSQTPVSFTVQNVNRSRVPCATDGRTYEIRGRIVGPRTALASESVRAGTLYLHGLGFGKFFWSSQALPQYDYAQKLARDGLVSVVIDRLGYDDSGHPLGTDSCLGGQADIANQVITQLRAGTYAAGGGKPTPAFGRLALAGHSVGGLLTQVTAYSFDNVDAVMVFAYSDRVVSPGAMRGLARVAGVCARGGARAEGQPGPPSYANLAPSRAAANRLLFADVERAAFAVTYALANLDPCGDTGSYMAAVQANLANVGSIDVPVFLLIGREDALYPPPAGPSQRALFTGSDDVTLVQVPGAGHALTVQRSAPQVREAASEWLLERGFGAGAS